MKVYYYIPLEEKDASLFYNGYLKITDVDFEDEIFEFDLDKDSVAQLVSFVSNRGSAIEITRDQYLEALGEVLYDMAGGNPCSFRDGKFSVSSENFSQICFFMQYPQATKGEFKSDGETYHSVSISF